MVKLKFKQMKLLTIFFILIFTYIADAQDVRLLKDIGSLYHNLEYATSYTGHKMYIDDHKSVILMGIYSGQESNWLPNPNPLFPAKFPLNNYFIQKLDINGNELWHKLIYSEDLFSKNIGGIGIAHTHYLNNIHVDKNENVFAGGTFKNQVEIDGVKSELDTSFSDNIFLTKIDKDGNLKYLIQGFSLSNENVGSEFWEITSNNDSIIYLSVGIGDSLVLHISTPDSIINKQYVINRSDFLSNKSKECAIIKINSNTGNIIDHKVIRSSTGNGRLAANLYVKENGNLVLFGTTFSSFIYDTKVKIYGSLKQKLYIAELDANLDNHPIFVDFGELSSGEIIQIREFEKIDDDRFMFSGFFRGEKLKLYNSHISGNLEKYVSFVGMVNIKTKTSSFINFGNHENFNNEICLSSDNTYVYALKKFENGDIIIGDTILTVNNENDDNLVLAKLNIKDLSIDRIIRFPSCIGPVGIHAIDNSLFLAANYYQNYVLYEKEVKSLRPDLWLSRLILEDVNSISEVHSKVKIYPNPTFNDLQVEGLDFDYFKIHNLYGQLVLADQINDQKINVYSLEPQIYFATFYKLGKIINQARFVKL